MSTTELLKEYYLEIGYCAYYPPKNLPILWELDEIIEQELELED